MSTLRNFQKKMTRQGLVIQYKLTGLYGMMRETCPERTVTSAHVILVQLRLTPHSKSVFKYFSLLSLLQFYAACKKKPRSLYSNKIFPKHLSWYCLLIHMQFQMKYFLFLSFARLSLPLGYCYYRCLF